MAKKVSIVPVQWSPGKGGLKSDIDPKNVRNGDLYVTGVDTGGLNIRSVGKGTNVSPDYEPMGGNELIYSLSSANVDNKIFRIELTINDITTPVNFECNLEVTTPTGNFITANSVTAPFIPGTFNATNILTQVETDLLAAFAIISPVTSVTTISASSAYLDIEFTSINFFDWNLINTISVDNNFEFSVNIIQEAVDQTMTGNWNLIGSDEKVGDCFQFWTTRRGLERKIEVFSVTSTGTIATINTVVAHNLTDGDSVSISSVEGSTEVNGQWIIFNATATSFDIEVYVPISAYVNSGTVATNIYGLGEIGVVVEDDAGAITYTRLLRSKEFNFSTDKQIDVRVKRKQDSNIACYFTDNYNQPRVFYYKGAYIADGGLAPNGRYEYGSIANEILWILSDAGFGIEFSSQSQDGGSLYSGNWRYAVRWLTSEFIGTEWSSLTNPVPVFSYNYETGPYTLGDVENTVTSKSNVLELTIAVPGVFTYAEIAAVNYIGTSLQAYIIGRYPLTGDTTEFITHTGNETGLINLDAGELNETFPGFVLAQNVELLDNRAILTNLTPAQVIDFTNWVQTFRYSLESGILNPVGVYSNSPNLVTGEYQFPGNVYSGMTHMIYETYRYGFRFKLKNGRMTDVFFYDDIKIDLPTVLPSKRDPGGFTSFNLTDDGVGGIPTEVYTIFINFYNFDLNYKIDGVFVKDLIQEIIPVRAEVNPTVLAMGMGVLGVAGLLVNGSYGMLYSDINSNSTGNSWTGPYPYAMGNDFPYSPLPPPFVNWYNGGNDIGGDAITLNNPPYPGNWANLVPSGAAPTSIFFYSPDMLWNHTFISSGASDQILLLGAPTRHSRYDTGPGTLPTVNNGWSGSYAEYNGYTNHTNNSTITSYNVSTSVRAQRGVGKIIVGGNEHSLNLCLGASTPFGGTEQFPNEKCQIIRVTSPIVDNGPAINYGALLMLYYRPLTNQYGEITNTKYQTVGAKLDITGFTGVIGSGYLNVYGDCFNQKTYLKQRYPGIGGYWFGGGYSFYTINRINSQLKRKRLESQEPTDVVPNLYIGDGTVGGDGWLRSPYSSNPQVPNEDIDAQLGYNEGYTPRNDIQYYVPFNANLEYQVDWANAIAWSDIESEGTNSDNLRNFPPLNLKFLDYTQGAITDTRALNGELITIQPREVQRQYFNTTSMINTTDGSEVILGDGSVLQRRGQTMTKFGSQHKWSIIMGRSDRGHDVLYGVDAINKAIWRIGYDGTTALDEINGIKSFVANNIQWIKGKYTPANGNGICGVSNQRYREVIWSFSGSAAGTAIAPAWQAEEISGNLIQGFESNLGQNLIQNPLFAGAATTPPVVPGWVSLSGAGASWQKWTGTGVESVYKPQAYGTNDYLYQSNSITLTPGSTYLAKIVITSYTPNLLLPQPIRIRFQLPSTPVYTINTNGTYYFLHTAVGGDDNFYIDSPASSFTRIQEVGLWEVSPTANWTGSPDWLLTPIGAECIGPGNLSMAVPPQSYLVQLRTHTLKYTISGCTAGFVTAYIGNQSDTPRNSDGTFTFTDAPTNVNPVVEFVPSAGFNGTITQSIYLYSTTPKYYSIGDIVSVYNPSFSGDYQIYECIEPHTNKYPPDYSDPSPEADSYWRLIPTTDPDYYTKYSLVFAELKNEFQSFFTPNPRIYSKFLDKYLVPRPIDDTGRVYLSDSGTPGEWFEEGGIKLESQAHFDAIINAPEGRKSFVALRVESESVPDQVRVYTNQHETYMDSSEFEQREGNEFDAPIMNDILTAPNGTPSENTSTLYGDYGLFRFIINSGTYNIFNSFIAKVRSRAREFMR